VAGSVSCAGHLRCGSDHPGTGWRRRLRRPPALRSHDGHRRPSAVYG